MSVLKLLKNTSNKSVVIDLEVAGDISTDKAEEARLLSLSITTGGNNIVLSEECFEHPELPEALGQFITNNTMVGVNLKFDMRYLEAYTGVKVDSYLDVQLAHYALFPAAGAHGLKDVTKKYFGFEDWDLPGKPYTKKASYDCLETFEDGSWHDQRDYSAGSGYERIPRDLLYR